MASNAVPTLASSTLSRNQLPSASVGSFQNQQIGQQTAGLGAGAAASALSPSQVALQQRATGPKTTAVSLNQRQSDILGHNDQNTALLKAAAQRKAAQQSQTVGIDGAGQQGTINTNVYGPDGKLDASRSKALSLAGQFVGKTPYVLGGESARGIDCSGLVQYVYNQLGYNVSQHSARWQGQNIPGVRTTIDKLRPGDLVAWKDGSHIAIYAGNGQIIEAAHPGTTVRVHNIWSSNVFGIALRLPGE